MIDRLLKKVFAPIVLFIPVAGYAGGVITDAKVTGVYCGNFPGQNMCSIYFDKDVSSSPSCAGASYKLRMQINTETNAGKAMLSLALSANSAGKVVAATGKGSCTLWGDTEDMEMLFISPPCAKTNNTWGCTNL